MNRTKRLAVVAGIGAAVAGGLLAPVVAWADPTPAPSATASTGPDAPSDAGRRGPHGGDRGQMAAKLAELLGVDEQKITTALEEIRTAGGRPSGDGRRGDQGQLAQALAAKLGVTAEKVTTALNTLRQQRATEAESALSERLKAAVSAGTLTQAEADAVLKAQRAGLLGGGPRGGHRGFGGTGNGAEQGTGQSS
ncbi:hypothetical protein [Streptosporangium carneum]|uniref:Uncharacterized protein n=1 Tax=Streptosporangium carneum TaxID=47481 RepID=A0A9W6I215_9ACTN|nr:hypothetical protein [Streptosporangium carneum]GLK10545.1 hypothetical protein GCM10017600_39510 [Streptosporangium carneum]